MSRPLRLEYSGAVYHLTSRGNARQRIFLDDNDRELFLSTLSHVISRYGWLCHAYCLMDNHYHLLLETKQENLSLMMRQVNSYYAIYFNKKEKRVGHLWQGRFRSWYVLNEDYLYLLLRYIESNPIKANLTNKIGEYPYTLSSALFGNSEIIPCVKGTILIHDFSPKTLIEFLETELSEEELDALNKEQKRKISVENEEIKMARAKPLHEHFNNIASKQERNCAIIRAFKDGHTQSSIANHLHLSAGLVCGVIKSED